MHTQNTKKRNKYYITRPKFTIFFLEKLPKTGKNCEIFARPLQNTGVLEVCAVGARKFCYF